MVVVVTMPLHLPRHFDGRQVWHDILTPIQNQKACGACWAIVTTSVLGERFAIHSGGQIRVWLSAAKPILCDWGPDERYTTPVLRASRENVVAQRQVREANEYALRRKRDVACTGASLYDAWRYLVRIGVPEEHCVPYDLGKHADLGSFSDNADVPRCQDVLGATTRQCVDGSPMRHFRASCMYEPTGGDSDEHAIMIDILRFGPTSSGFIARQHFYDWDGRGVYRCDASSRVRGGHAVKIVGWGESQADGKYWICANSWGRQWGYDGYFYMHRQCEYCQLERHAVTGLPDVPGMRPQDTGVDFIWLPHDRRVRDEWRLHPSGYHVDDVRTFGSRLDLAPLVAHTERLPNYTTLVAADPTTWMPSSSPTGRRRGVNAITFRLELQRDRQETLVKRSLVVATLVALAAIVVVASISSIISVRQR